MHTSRSRRRISAALGVAVVAAGLTSAATMAAPTRAFAADQSGQAPAVTVQPDPSYQGRAFEGWGTSLAWFANVTGAYPDEIRNRLANLVFGKNGLDLNIARYNIGGGNAPDVPNYLRPGAAVEGWWKAPAGTTRTDTNWWDPNNPQDWNLQADQTQRWWVDRIKGDITQWEAFSNSPPWFQTVSGYVSGNFNAGQDQLKTSSIDDYTSYLAGVVKELERAHGINVATVDPFNEPNTTYWGTTLGPDGNPTGGRQEGAHMGPQLMGQVIRSLAPKLADDPGTRVSAMDETNPGTFVTDWNGYPSDARAEVGQLNVHTYGTGQRTSVRDIAKAEDKPPWMSEFEGSWGSGQSFTSMDPGIGMASHIVDDLRELEPTAWVLWQPVEDYDNMKPGGESAAGANWGEIQMPFNCTAQDTLQTCPIYTNTKFDTIRNFTHYIRPGDHLVKVNDVNSTAAVNDTGATVVHVNSAAQAQPVTLDLSKFRTISPHATVTPVLSDADHHLQSLDPIPVMGNSVTLTVPADSVTTFVIDGVNGVAHDAPLVQHNHIYRLQGVQSGRSLTPSGDSLVLHTNAATGDAASGPQLWDIRELAGGDSNGARYAVCSATDGRQLAVIDGALTLVAPGDDPAPSAQWILSTTGDGTYTLVNVGTKELVDVGGQATADGSPVGAYGPTSGSNQRWSILDETVTEIAPTPVFTVPGTAPQLPATVSATLAGGRTAELPVTWNVPGDGAWGNPGTVVVTGRATDALGATHLAKAEVTVDTLVSTLPARAKTYVGGQPTLPTTVTAVGEHGSTTSRPVAWDDTPADAFDQTGVVELHGLADAGDGRTLPATVRVQVTEPVEENAAQAAGTVISASYTESGYGTSGLTNGVLTDKAWSNWRSGTKDPSDTLTVTLPAQRTVTGVRAYWYKDGSADSWPLTVTVQTRAADGSWVDVGPPVSLPGGTAAAPITTVPVPATVTNGVRLLMTARPNGGYIQASELQVLASAPGKSADSSADAITVNGQPMAGFAPTTTSYDAPWQGAVPRVAAEAADPYAHLTVTQPTGGDRTATVRITAEDGTTSTTYTLRFGS